MKLKNRSRTIQFASCMAHKGTERDRKIERDKKCLKEGERYRSGEGQRKR